MNLSEQLGRATAEKAIMTKTAAIPNALLQIGKFLLKRPISSLIGGSALGLTANDYLGKGNKNWWNPALQSEYLRYGNRGGGNFLPWLKRLVSKPIQSAMHFAGQPGPQSVEDYITGSPTFGDPKFTGWDPVTGVAKYTRQGSVNLDPAFGKRLEAMQADASWAKRMGLSMQNGRWGMKTNTPASPAAAAAGAVAAKTPAAAGAAAKKPAATPGKPGGTHIYFSPRLSGPYSRRRFELGDTA